MKIKKLINLVLILLLVITLSGCLKPIDHPLREEMTESEFQAFVEPLKDTTVAIVSKVLDQELGIGSGSIIKKEPSINPDLSYYYVLTNYHVVEGGVSFDIHTNFNRVEVGDVYATPSNSVNYSFYDQDIALVRFESDFDYPLLEIIPLENPSIFVQVSVGQSVFGIGTPFSLDNLNSVSTMGIIKNVSTNWITNSANINPGNSGGPLFSADGTFIGINTQRVEVIDGIEYRLLIDSMHVNHVADVITERFNNASVNLGIHLQTMSEFIQNDHLIPGFVSSDHVDVNQGGIVIISVAQTKPAQAGLMRYDQIIKVNGVDVHQTADISSVLGVIAIGNVYTFTVIRQIDGQYQTIDVDIEITHR